MSTSQLSEDGRAIALLCTDLALPRRAVGPQVKPLSIGEWNRLAVRIGQSSWKRPAALFGRNAAELASTLEINLALSERIARLLERGGQFAIEIERLADRGIRLLSRADEAYPSKLRQRLRGQAPPVLFYAGPVSGLSTSGVAVVGSRDVDPTGAEFARDFGRRCARAQLTVFSGAARGVDLLAMHGVLEADGRAVGIVADSLERALRAPDVRQHVLADRLTLATPFHPAAIFAPWRAMQRNKLIYGLSDYAVVVASGNKSGGTWAGADENLREGWVPVFVRTTGDLAGNAALIARGGIALDPSNLPLDGNELGSWLAARAAGCSGFRLEEAARPPETIEYLPDTARGDAEKASEGAEQVEDADLTATKTLQADLFPVVWPHLERYLREPRSASDVAAMSGLQLGQARVWLERAAREGLAEASGRPKVYRSAASAPEQPELFVGPTPAPNLGPGKAVGGRSRRHSQRRRGD